MGNTAGSRAAVTRTKIHPPIPDPKHNRVVVSPARCVPRPRPRRPEVRKSRVAHAAARSRGPAKSRSRAVSRELRVPHARPGHGTGSPGCGPPTDTLGAHALLFEIRER